MPTSSARSRARAQLRWLEKGEFQVLTVPDWLDRVRKRPSAKAEGKPREDFIVTIDRSDDQTAFIKVRCQLPRYFAGLSGGDETERRLEDRLEILPLRSAQVMAGYQDFTPPAQPPCRRCGGRGCPDLAHHHGRLQQPLCRRALLRIGGPPRKAVRPALRRQRAAMCSTIYQLMKRTFGGHGGSTWIRRNSVADGNVAGVSITAAARAKPPRGSAAPASRAFAEQHRFLRRHRHALAVDRIETAQGVATPR